LDPYYSVTWFRWDSKKFEHCRPSLEAIQNGHDGAARRRDPQGRGLSRKRREQQRRRPLTAYRRPAEKEGAEDRRRGGETSARAGV